MYFILLYIYQQPGYYLKLHNGYCTRRWSMYTDNQYTVLAITTEDTGWIYCCQVYQIF